MNSATRLPDRESVLRQQAQRELIRRRVFRDKDIPYLISLMSAVDQRTGEKFTFEHVRDPLEEGEVWLEGNKLRSRDKNWRWQRWIVDHLLKHKRTIHLKGRQIGDTWIHLAVDVAEAILMPGTTSLLFRQREDEAIDNVRRWWILYNSLPDWLLQQVPAGNKVGPIVVDKPAAGKADRPGRDGVALKFADGSFSEIVPMTSSASSGHGRTVRRVNTDEAGHIELLLSIRAAVEPAAGTYGSINHVSTANGTSNPETGEGNEFHRLWMTADDVGYHKVFLPFDLHPDRDEEWYERAEEVISLPIWKRQEQFPRNETEAFALSDRCAFDEEALHEYGEKASKLLRRYDFVPTGQARVRVDENDQGRIRVYSEPDSGRPYAIGADVATGRGSDYSAAYVVDLTSGELVCEYHARVEADVYARDLHFLGRKYNTALIAVEVGGGYGDAVIIALRDGAAGRRPYPKLYRHIQSVRPDKPIHKNYGFPTSTKTRPLILNQLERHLRERTWETIPAELLLEMQVFVHHDHGTSPRARPGNHDDRVMAAAIAMEMFRLHGDIGGKSRTTRRRSARPKPSYPWQRAS